MARFIFMYIPEGSMLPSPFPFFPWHLFPRRLHVPVRVSVPPYGRLVTRSIYILYLSLKTLYLDLVSVLSHRRLATQLRPPMSSYPPFCPMPHLHDSLQTKSFAACTISTMLKTLPAWSLDPNAKTTNHLLLSK